MPAPRIKDVKECNASFRRLLTMDVPIPIRPIPLERLKLIQFSDSALGNADGGRSQCCHMICGTDERMREGKEAPVSNPRAGSSSLLVEANALSEALAEAEWVTSWLLHARDLHYDARRRQTLNREIKITSVMRQPESELKELIAVIDAKSMYDNLIREQFTCAEEGRA